MLSYTFCKSWLKWGRQDEERGNQKRNQARKADWEMMWGLFFKKTTTINQYLQYIFFYVTIQMYYWTISEDCVTICRSESSQKRQKWHCCDSCHIFCLIFSVFLFIFLNFKKSCWPKELFFVMNVRREKSFIPQKLTTRESKCTEIKSQSAWDLWYWNFHVFSIIPFLFYSVTDY